VPVWNHIVLTETPSTNSWIKEQLRADLPPWTAVRSIAQTQGRGRLGRSWICEPGLDLATSLAVPVHNVDPKLWGSISLLTAVALSSCLDQFGVEHAIKWPNDLAAPYKNRWHKIAGILCESLQTPDGPFAIVGLGINLNSLASQHALEVPACSVLEMRQEAVEIDAFWSAFLGHFGTFWDQGLEATAPWRGLLLKRLLGMGYVFDWSLLPGQASRRIRLSHIDEEGHLWAIPIASEYSPETQPNCAQRENAFVLTSGELSWKSFHTVPITRGETT
jgi:BirA family biotin operon repressor/biotin-[acetyl-CoA-carboxylase] ligase